MSETPAGGLQFDEIGIWSEIKHEIVRQYASAYSTILAAPRQRRFKHYYIDAFCGGGIHFSKTSKEIVLGSPLYALKVEPRFQKFFFIDLNGKKVEQLRNLTAGQPGVEIFEGDCNSVLQSQVFPNVRFDCYERALCLLDPYGLHLDWEVMKQAGQSQTIDMFLNFPIMDMNRNAIWKTPENVPPDGVIRMNRFWGDESWRKAAYEEEQTLFGTWLNKTDNSDIVDAFRKRLKDVAGFKFVPEPLAMRNSAGAEIYYLFFASQNSSGDKIARAIFKKHR